VCKYKMIRRSYKRRWAGGQEKLPLIRENGAEAPQGRKRAEEEGAAHKQGAYHHKGPAETCVWRSWGRGHRAQPHLTYQSFHPFLGGEANLCRSLNKGGIQSVLQFEKIIGFALGWRQE
jgi:hypothetical protein